MMGGPELEPELLHDPLTAITPIDGRYWDEVKELSPYASEAALINMRVMVETSYLLALSDAGVIRHISEIEKEFYLGIGEPLPYWQVVKIKEIEESTKHDVKAVERGVRMLLDGTTLFDLTRMVHFGLTSEDINNLSYRLLLDGAVKEICVPKLNEIIDNLVDKAEKYKSTPMLARTHGQPAVPTTLGKEFIVFAVRLNREVRKISAHQLTGKLNGAVGNYNALYAAMPFIDWKKFSENFVKGFGLKPNLNTTQINPYEDMIELFQTFQRVNGILIDLDQDMWRYISDGWLVQTAVKGEVGSSTMPQKVNPINFENSEGNLQIANAFWEVLGRELSVSRLQRDLSDSTLVRNVGSALAYGLLAHKNTLNGLNKIRPDIKKVKSELNDNWSILSEGAQTILRLYGVHDPYSMVEQFVKGRKVNNKSWHKWISSLDVDDEAKQKLMSLTPETYVGLAEELTDIAIEEIKSSRNKSG